MICSPSPFSDKHSKRHCERIGKNRRAIGSSLSHLDKLVLKKLDFFVGEASHKIVGEASHKSKHSEFEVM